MRTIVKHYKTRKAAERYQMLLYNKYDHVRLVRSPSLMWVNESGNYVWEVK